MKFVLNGREDLAMDIDSLTRNLNFGYENAIYDIFVSSENIDNAFTMSNLSQFIGQPITSYALYNKKEDEDEYTLVMGETDVVVTIVNFSETYTPTVYNSGASFQVQKV